MINYNRDLIPSLVWDMNWVTSRIYKMSKPDLRLNQSPDPVLGLKLGIYSNL